MTDYTVLIPDGKPQRHRWFERTPFPVRDANTGNERHERVCEFCHGTRTTVINPRGDVWIEWETEAGVKKIGGLTPPCVPKPVMKEGLGE